jgi:hypothetical protein
VRRGALVAVLTAAACRTPSAPAARAFELDTVRTEFNAQADRVRVIAGVSPT